MNRHELCQTCRPYEHCLFEKAANDIANSVPPEDQQTPLATGENPTKEASDAHKRIALLREFARSYGCPNVNKVNPDYPGIKNL